MIFKIVLLVTLLLVAYTWLGYPVLLWLARILLRRLRQPSTLEKYVPTVSIVVAVHNEASLIAAKLDDCLALCYPRECLEILVASDGSTDTTEHIVQDFSAHDPRIRLLRTAGRAGKSGAQNLAVESAFGDIVLFTDAETRTRPDLLQQLAEDFSDPRIGMVAPTVYFGDCGTSVSKGQGAYWRFELFLRQLESDLGILATASGAALAMRRNLYRPIPPQYGDDCVLPLEVRLAGYRVLQDARAIVTDTMPHTVAGEFRTRVRMTSRNWSGILSRPGLLNPLRFPATAWSLVSHKFLRWMTPFVLAAAFLANGVLALRGQMAWLFALQCCFYIAATIGWKRSRGERSGRVFARVFGYPFAFCLANLGFLLGVVKCLRGQTVVAYK